MFIHVWIFLCFSRDIRVCVYRSRLCLYNKKSCFPSDIIKNLTTQSTPACAKGLTTLSLPDIKMRISVAERAAVIPF